MPENLVPFKEGKDGKGRPRSVFSTDQEIDLLAEAICNGHTIVELAEIFNCDKGTIVRNKKDPRVRAACQRHIEDRVLRVTRKVDSVIEARLHDAASMQTETLLKVRREFLGGALRLQTQGGSKDAATINEAMSEIEKNPEFAKELQDLLAKPASS